MDNLTRIDLINSYGNAYSQVVNALKMFPVDMWKYKPSEKSWSIHEIIIHLADSEANSFTRCRKFIAEPGGKIIGYDQDLWAKSCDYHNQNTDDALELFRYLRKMSFDLIKDLPESIWQNTLEHNESGTMTFERWLIIYEQHIRGHIEQMDRVYNDWKKSNV